MEQRKRKNILSSCSVDATKTFLNLAEKNIKRIKLRRQKIFTQHRMEMIKKSLNPPQLFGKNFSKNTKSPIQTEDENAKEIILTLEILKDQSEELENLLERNEPYDICNEQKNVCTKSIISLRKILQKDSSSMTDEENSPVPNAFIQNNGVEILIPFIKFEHHENILKETVCCLANL